MHTKKHKKQLSMLATSLAAGSCLCLPQTARATIADSYGISARSMALGNANSAGDNGAHAAFFNPASLTNSTKTQISVSYINNSLNLSDINTGLRDQASGLPADTYRASAIKQVNGASLGVNLPLLDGIHAGISAYMPRDNFGRLWGGAPTDSFYLRLGDRQQRPAIFTALAFDLPAGFTIGLGSYYTLKAQGQLQMALSPSGSAARFGLDMKPVFIPYGGVEWDLNLADTQITLGATYRAEQSEIASIDTSLALNLDAASLPISLQTSLAPFFDPEMIKAAGAISSGKYKLFASIEFARWSQYTPPEIELEGEDIDSLSKAQTLENSPLKDALTYRLGYEYQFPLADSQALALRIGAERFESANRDDKNKNLQGLIIDPARTSVALGLGYQIPTMFRDQQRMARFEMALQSSMLDSNTYSVSENDEQNGLTVTAEGQVLSLVGGVNYEM